MVDILGLATALRAATTIIKFVFVFVFVSNQTWLRGGSSQINDPDQRSGDATVVVRMRIAALLKLQYHSVALGDPLQVFFDYLVVFPNN